MIQYHESNASSDQETLQIASVLLILQGGFGLVSALGLVAFAGITRSLGQAGGPALFAFVVPICALVCAAGVAACRRWAQIGAMIFESLIVLGAAVRLLISAGATAALVPLVTTIVLPAAVTALLLSRSARQAIATRAARMSTARRPTLSEPAWTPSAAREQRTG